MYKCAFVYALILINAKARTMYLYYDNCANITDIIVLSKNTCGFVQDKERRRKKSMIIRTFNYFDKLFLF